MATDDDHTGMDTPDPDRFAKALLRAVIVHELGPELRDLESSLAFQWNAASADDRARLRASAAGVLAAYDLENGRRTRRLNTVYHRVCRAAVELDPARMHQLPHGEEAQGPGFERTRALLCADFAARTLGPLVAFDIGGGGGMASEYLNGPGMQAVIDVATAIDVDMLVEDAAMAAVADAERPAQLHDRASIGVIDMCARAVSAVTTDSDQADRDAAAWTARAIVYAGTIDEIREPLWLAVVELLRAMVAVGKAGHEPRP